MTALWLLACNGPHQDHDVIEFGDWDDEDFSFRVQSTRLVTCTTAEGANRAYAHAQSRSEGGCMGERMDLDCDALQERVGDDCNVSPFGSAEDQLQLWFTDWDPDWPTDAVFESGRHWGCKEPGYQYPAGFDGNLSNAWFTPDENSTELLIGGTLHGVLNVTVCDP